MRWAPVWNHRDPIYGQSKTGLWICHALNEIIRDERDLKQVRLVSHEIGNWCYECGGEVITNRKFGNASCARCKRRFAKTSRRLEKGYLTGTLWDLCKVCYSICDCRALPDIHEHGDPYEDDDDFVPDDSFMVKKAIMQCVDEVIEDRLRVEDYVFRMVERVVLSTSDVYDIKLRILSETGYDITPYIPKSRDEDIDSNEDCESIEIVDNTEYSVPKILNSDNAVKPKRSRGSRGGKHVRHKKDGYCYLKLTSRKHRGELSSIGKNPSVLELTDALTEKPVRNDGVILKMKSDGHFHAVYEHGLSTHKQLDYLRRELPNRKVGSTAFDYEQSELAEVALAMFHHDLEFGSAICAEEPNPTSEIDPEWLARCPRSLTEKPGDVKVEVDTNVKAPGTCWQQLAHIGCMPLSWSISVPEDVTADMMAEAIDKIPSYMRAVFKWELQDDGDLHMAGVKVATKATVDGMSDAHYSAWIADHMTITKSIKWLKEHNKKLVGKPAVAPYDKAVAQFTHPDIKRTVESYRSGSVAYDAAEIASICPFAIPPEVQHHMQALRLPWSETSGKVVEHPIHNAVRRWELKVCLPRMIHGPVTLVSMTDTNVEMFKTGMRDAGKGDIPITIVNPIIDLKDLGRYLNKKEDIPDEVFALPTLTTEYVVFHNSGHYMDEATMLYLDLKNPEVKFWIPTMVYPLECLVSSTPTRPELAHWYFTGERLVYIPEGDTNNAYEQPKHPGLLIAKSIRSDDGDQLLRGGIYNSKLNTHVMMFTRFNVTTHSTITVHVPDLMPLPRLRRGWTEEMPMIRRDDYVAMFEYAKVLERAKDTDMWGKLRQLSDKTTTYFPVSAKTRLVDTVMLAARLDVLGGLQSKEIRNLGHAVYYKTIGTLVRYYHQSHNTKIAKRHSKLIDEPTQMVPVPRLDVKVRGGSVPGHYGVEWKAPPEEKSRLQSLLPNFLQLWFADKSKEYSIKVNDQGVLAFYTPLCVTHKNFVRYGPKVVCYSQTRVFREKVLKRDKPKPIPLRHPIYAPDPKLDPFSDDHAVELEDEPPDDPPEEEPPSDPPPKLPDEETCSEVSDETDLSYADIQCCDEHPGYSEWSKTYETTSDFYMNVCAQRKAASSHPHFAVKEYMQRMLEATLSRYKRIPNQQDEVKTFPVPKPMPVMDAAKLEAMWENPPNNIIKRQKGKEKDKSEYPKEVLLPSDNPITRSKLVSTVEQEKLELANLAAVKKKPNPHETAADDWQKIMKNKPESLSVFQQYAGVAQWDAMYPHTVDKRINKLPFSDVRMYPVIDYPEEDCLLEAIETITGQSRAEILFHCLYSYPGALIKAKRLSTALLDVLGCKWRCSFRVVTKDSITISEHGLRNTKTYVLILHDDHFSADKRQPGLIVKSIKPPKHGAPPRFEQLLAAVKALPVIKFQEWDPEPTRASQYLREVIDRTTGTLGNDPINAHMLKSLEDTLSGMTLASQTRMFAVVEGDPGCRKSSALQKVLKNMAYKRDRLYSMVAATQILRQDWKDKLAVLDKDPVTGRGAPNTLVNTFETAIANQTWGHLMVFDEDKYPKGYMALIALLFPWVKYFIFLCDRYQSEWHEPNANCLLNDSSILGNGAFYSNLNQVYLVGTWRFGPNIANFWRMPTFNSHEGGFHFTETEPKSWQELKNFFPHMTDEAVHTMWEHKAMFYASHAAAQWAEDMKNISATTFSGSQGLSVPLAIVEVDARVLKMSDYRITYTVLTRAQNVIVIRSYADTGQNRSYLQSHEVWRELMWYFDSYRIGTPVVIHPAHTVDIRELTERNPASPVTPIPRTNMKLAGPWAKVKNKHFVRPYITFNPETDYIDPDETNHAQGGARLEFDSEVYKEAYEFKPFIDPVVEPIIREPLVREPMLFGAKMRTHAIPSMNDAVFESHQSEVIDRYRRELSKKGLYSEQNPDTFMWRRDSGKIRYNLIMEHAKKHRSSVKQARIAVNKFLANVDPHDNPMMYQPHAVNWGSLQSARDQASFAAAVATRITFSTYEENNIQYKSTEDYGHALYLALCKHWNWEPGAKYPLIHQRKADAIQQFQIRRGERSQELQRMSLNRSSPDYHDLLTAKSQLKLKSAQIPVAKPLQTILVRGDAYLFRMGWVGIYLLDCILEEAPPWIYLHAKKTVSQMKQWMMTNLITEQYELVDATQLDKSVRGEAVTLMELLMRRYSVPEEDISFYRDDKLNFHTKYITFAIMTFSGEIFTWLTNTMKTVAREALKYDMSPGQALAGSGDDIERVAGLQVSPKWRVWEPFDFVIEKREVSSTGSFCSFSIRDGIVFKDPIVLYMRLMAKLEMGDVDNVVLSYLDMFMSDYDQSEALVTVLNDVEMEHYSALKYIFFNLRKYGYKGKIDWSRYDHSVMDREATAIEQLGFLSYLDEFLVPLESLLESNDSRFNKISQSAVNHTLTYFD